MKEKKRFDFLWLVLFAIVFINGFEAGGYQASLRVIGVTYDLSITEMGLFASVELFATMLAPLFLGIIADQTNKKEIIRIFLIIQLLGAGFILVTTSNIIFVAGVFLLGMTTSALQVVAIASLTDSYPVSGSSKLGFLTSMYALGAFVAPLVVDKYLFMGFHWRTLFALLAIGSVITYIGMVTAGDYVRETVTEDSSDSSAPSNTKFYVFGILLLCVIMLIYVGFENGFAFFVESLFANILVSSKGRLALSIFWIFMIPSRFCVGFFAKKAKGILIAAVFAIPIVAVIIALVSSADVVLVLCAMLGFASGAIYPSVLNIMLSFAGKKTATATGMITTATGIGGWLFTAITGYIGDKFSLRIAIMVLAAFFVFSIAAAFIACKKATDYSVTTSAKE
ncbi:MFS transporter [Butyrivibrio proteoclasticus]|uniref:MFS transporter n=1 Tax=Butyrivibrio proteoclasticus TaxID=43305 RepID=UPI00047BA943|nr:MFS transporter [Butyrivibrio proteoclasticus]